MFVFLNGNIVPEERAVVSAFDRGFLYGDGVFEALRISNGKPFRWSAHLERLERGADFLKIRTPFARNELKEATFRLIEANAASEAILRIVLSRGSGPRGYSPKGAGKPTLV